MRDQHIFIVLMFFFSVYFSFNNSGGIYGGQPYGVRWSFEFPNFSFEIVIVKALISKGSCCKRQVLVLQKLDYFYPLLCTNGKTILYKCFNTVSLKVQSVILNIFE